MIADHRTGAPRLRDAGALRLGSASLSARSAQGEGAFAPSPRRQRRRPSRAPGHVILSALRLASLAQGPGHPGRRAAETDAPAEESAPNGGGSGGSPPPLAPNSSVRAGVRQGYAPPCRSSPSCASRPASAGVWSRGVTPDPYVTTMLVRVIGDDLRLEEDVALPTDRSLPTFLSSLHEDFRGWDGERDWASLDTRQLRIATRHRGRTVALRWTLAHRWHVEEASWTFTAVTSTSPARVCAAWRARSMRSSAHRADRRAPGTPGRRGRFDSLRSLSDRGGSGP